MGRGRSSSGGGGGRSSSSSGGRGWSSSGRGRHSGSRTTVIIGGRRYYSDGGSAGSNSFIPVIIFFIIFAICTLATGISTIAEASKYSTVNGVAISNRDSGVWYYTTYEYTIDGTEYVNESDVGWEIAEDEGKIVKLYYLKDDPNFITEEKPADMMGGVACLIISSAFIAGIVIFIRLEIKNRKKLKEGELVEVEQTSSKSSDDKIKCPYCGTKYDKNDSSCPNCGASNK
ncbi:MAG: zinc ribbon domain-containing protein [Clostridia bacterium]|nr:zinc ribbon domain-containing protein [Clostridia bacterium]